MYVINAIEFSFFDFFRVNRTRQIVVSFKSISGKIVKFLKKHFVFCQDRRQLVKFIQLYL